MSVLIGLFEKALSLYTAFLLVQNKFKDFLDFMGRSYEDEVHKFSSRSAWRKEIGKTSINDIAEQLIEDVHKEKPPQAGTLER